MKLAVATLSSTLMRWWRASLLASPTVVPASTVPWRWIAPVRARIASSSVVRPAPGGAAASLRAAFQGEELAMAVVVVALCSSCRLSSTLRSRVPEGRGRRRGRALGAAGRGAQAGAPDRPRDRAGRRLRLAARPELARGDPGPVSAGRRHPCHHRGRKSLRQDRARAALGLRVKLVEEMKGRIEPDESGVPVPDGPYAYGANTSARGRSSAHRARADAAAGRSRSCSTDPRWRRASPISRSATTTTVRTIGSMPT